MLLYIGDFVSFSVVHYLYIDKQPILCTDCESYKCVEFIGSAKVWWGHKSFLYIISCHLQMIIILLLHIQFEYFLLSLADVLSVILQLQCDQEWQEQALSFFINLTRRIFNFLLSFSMTLAVGLICDVWFCWDTFDISCSESCVGFFFVTESWFFTCFFSVSIEVIMWIFILSHVSNVCVSTLTYIG